jgi:hypothetical protein
MRSVTRLAAVATLLLVGAAAPVHAVSPSEELMAVDRAFAAKAQEIGVGKAFELYAAPTARMIALPDPKLTPEQAGKLFPPDFQMDWDPQEAFVSKSGDMGWTWGRATRKVKDKDGKLVERNSQYLSIWEKQPDGSWKFVADTGNDTGPGFKRTK